MKKYNCPDCGKELIRLEPFKKGIYELWCDDCDIDIVITKNNETLDGDNVIEEPCGSCGHLNTIEWDGISRRIICEECGEEILLCSLCDCDECNCSNCPY